jgi:hypothetical protein
MRKGVCRCPRSPNGLHRTRRGTPNRLPSRQPDVLCSCGGVCPAVRRGLSPPPDRPPRPARLLVRLRPSKRLRYFRIIPPWRAGRVRRADGPERVFCEWWKQDAEFIAVRDYFQKRTTPASVSGSSASATARRPDPIAGTFKGYSDDPLRRQDAIDKAQAALNKAEEGHAKRAEVLRAQIEAIETRVQAEDSNRSKEAKRLKAALRGPGLRGAAPECVNQPRFLPKKICTGLLKLFPDFQILSASP